MDLVKLNSKKKSSDKGLLTQASLAKMKYDASVSQPTVNDDGANIFGAMRQQLGNGPQRGWRAGVAGLLDGLALGSKSAANNERREKLQKMTDIFTSLEGVANEAAKRNQMHEKQVALQEQITPTLEALTKNIKTLPYDDVMKVGNDLVNQINQSGGTNYKISMVDQQNGRVLLTEAGKPDQKYDLFEMFPKIREEQNVEWLTKRALQVQEEQDRRDEQQLGINQQNADAIQSRVDFSQDEEKQAKVAASKKQAEQNVKEAKELDSKVQDQQSFLNNLDKMEKIIENSKLTGTGATAELARYFAKTFNLDSQYAVDSLGMLGKGFLGMAKDLFGSRVTNMDLVALNGIIPTMDKNPQASLDQIKRLKKKIKPEIDTNLNKLKTIQEDVGANIHTPESANIHAPKTANITPETPLILTPEEQQAAGKNNMPERSETVIMKFPDGTSRAVPLGEQKKYEQYGGVARG